MFQLLILFGDNDFSYLGRRILDVMKEDINIENVTKEWVVNYWNTLAAPLYKCIYSVKSSVEDYLLITEEKVLLGKEVSEFLEENYQRGANYEWFMLTYRDIPGFDVTVI